MQAHTVCRGLYASISSCIWQERPQVLLRAWIPDTALDMMDNAVMKLIVGSVLNMVYFLGRECYED